MLCHLFITGCQFIGIPSRVLGSGVNPCLFNIELNSPFHVYLKFGIRLLLRKERQRTIQKLDSEQICRMGALRLEGEGTGKR